MLDIIAIIVSVISFFVSVFTWWKSYKQEQYEFESMEATKSDFLKFISALKSIARKSTYAHLFDGKDKTNIEDELKIINSFLVSDTWLVIQHTINDKESLLLFYTNIMILLYSGDIREKGNTSVQILETVAKICRNYFDDIAKSKKKYSSNIADYVQLDEVTSNFYCKYKKNLSKNDIENLEKLRKIKNDLNKQGKFDPDVDLWLHLLSPSEFDFEKIHREANPNITLTELLEKYEHNN